MGGPKPFATLTDGMVDVQIQAHTARPKAGRPVRTSAAIGAMQQDHLARLETPDQRNAEPWGRLPD